MGHLLTPRKVLSAPIPPVRWLVEPLIPWETRVLVFGESGSMKSWVLLSLGLHLAAGRHWLADGNPPGGFRIERPYRVLYIDEEMPRDDTWERIWKLCKGHDIPPDVPFACWNRGHFRARNELDARRLCEVVEKACADEQSPAWPPEVVIVETMRQVMVGSENDSGNVADLWAHLAPLSDDRTLILSHHMTKPQPGGEGQVEVRHRARGSGRMIDHPDVAFACLRPSRQLDVVQLEHVKARRRKEHPTIGIELVHPAGDSGPALWRRADEQACRILPFAPPQAWRSGRALPYNGGEPV